MMHLVELQTSYLLQQLVFKNNILIHREETVRKRQGSLKQRLQKKTGLQSQQKTIPMMKEAI